MKFSTKIFLGVMAFVLLCAVYYSDDYFSKKSEQKKEELSKALYFKTEDALKLTLKNKSGSFVFSRDNKNSQWKIIEPQKINADQTAITSLLTTLSQINVQQELDSTAEISKNKNASLKDFGLDAPQLTAVVELENKTSLTLNIGSGLELGNKTDTPISVYGLNASRPKVLLLEAGNVNYLNAKTFSDLRTKNVGQFKSEEVDAIKIQTHGSKLPFIVQKKDNKWIISNAKYDAGDDLFISNFIHQYQSLVAQSVIEQKDFNLVGLKKFDLEQPAATIYFSDKNRKALQEFKLGITKESVYILMPDGAVGKLNLSSWPDYVPKNIKFQNRQFLLGLDMSKIKALQMKPNLFYTKKDANWYKMSQLKEDIKADSKPNTEAISLFSNFEYMIADDIIFNPSKAELSKYNLKDSSKKITLIFNEDQKQTPIEIKIGRKALHNDKNIYIKRSDLPYVYEVNADWLKHFEKLM